MMDGRAPVDAGSRALDAHLTAVLKFPRAETNIRVATGAMEGRGARLHRDWGHNSRLIRDAHIGVLWEGTSNIETRST